MFILLAQSGSNCRVLDTSDFEVDTVSEQFCKDMIKKGYAIKGITVLKNSFYFSPRQGVIPSSLGAEGKGLRRALLDIQLGGYNLEWCTLKKRNLNKDEVASILSKSSRIKAIQLMAGVTEIFANLAGDYTSKVDIDLLRLVSSNTIVVQRPHSNGDTCSHYVVLSPQKEVEQLIIVV